MQILPPSNPKPTFDEMLPNEINVSTEFSISEIFPLAIKVVGFQGPGPRKADFTQRDFKLNMVKINMNQVMKKYPPKSNSIKSSQL